MTLRGRNRLKGDRRDSLTAVVKATAVMIAKP
jgi:hypothetical protein